MATRPTVTTISAGAIYSASTLTANFEALRDAFDLLLGLDGTTGSNNTLTGDIDFGGKTIRNALFDGTTVGMEWQGNWATATSYTANDVVRDATDNIVYICTTTHTSSGTEPLASNADSAKWAKMVDASSLTGLADIVDDTTPQLGANLDTNAFNIAFDDTKGILDESGNEQLLFGTTGSAVNELKITNAATGNGPSLTSTGGDTNIDIKISPKGSGRIDADTSIIENVTDPTGAQHAATKNYVDTFAPTVSLPIGYISGLIVSNNGVDADHDIDISTGTTRGADNDEDITLSSAQTKRLDASWATGSAAGGLSSSLTIAADTWYHVHAIVVSSTSEIGFDTSVTAANLVTDHSATAYRRIGSILTDSSANILGFFNFNMGQSVQYSFDTLIETIATGNTPTTRTLTTTSTPLGVKVQAKIRVYFQSGSGAVNNGWFDSPEMTDFAPNSTTTTAANFGDGGNSAGTSFAFTELDVWTNTSSQIAYRCSTAQTHFISTAGWIDHRTV